MSDSPNSGAPLRWLAASNEIAVALLQSDDEEAALALLARRAREVLVADVAALVLPAPDGEWLVEVVDGQKAAHLVGTVMPAGGRSRATAAQMRGLLVADLSTEPLLRVPALRSYGPALYAPLESSGSAIGTLLLLRQVGAEPFSDADLAAATGFARQAALALTLAESRRQAERNALLEQRAEIARDLHDFVVQELFATGVRLEALQRKVSRGELVEVAELGIVEDGIDEAVAAIRDSIRSLRDPMEGTSLRSRLEREVARARTQLGFDPRLLVDVDLDREPLDEELVLDLAAITREALSNVARHAKASSATVTAALSHPSAVITRSRHPAPSPVIMRSRHLRLEITDDGQGLPDRIDRRSGLDTMVERARRHRGGAEVASAPGGGTAVRVTIPLNDPTA
ncbi:MAG TPA: histidine kinase [Actinomycetales bacterium]|nr:histidine kinase [Actinomycetales bacterium]